MRNFDVCLPLRTGVYHTWEECKAQVHQFPAAIHKAFKSNGEAAAFIDKHGQNRGFACSGGAQAADVSIVPARAPKRRRKAAKVAAATPAALQEPPSDGHVSGAQPEHASAVCADADTAAGSAADGAAMPTIWSSMLYRLVRIDTR
jgi:ribonuclease HI